MYVSIYYIFLAMFQVEHLYDNISLPQLDADTLKFNPLKAINKIRITSSELIISGSIRLQAGDGGTNT